MICGALGVMAVPHWALFCFSPGTQQMFQALWSSIGQTRFQSTDQTIDKGLPRTLQTLCLLTSCPGVWHGWCKARIETLRSVGWMGSYCSTKVVCRLLFGFSFKLCQKLQWFCRDWGWEQNHHSLRWVFSILQLTDKSLPKYSQMFLYDTYVVNRRLSCCGAVSSCPLQLSSLFVMLIFSS